MNNSRIVEQTDVVIIGAGPAGAITAIELSQKGFKTLVIEASELPRYKCCGGGIVPRAQDFIPPNIAIPWECSSLMVEMHMTDPKHHFVAKGGAPIASTVMRRDFDDALLAKAKTLGTYVWSPCRVSHLYHRGNIVEVGTPRGYVAAHFVVIADGALGTTAKHAGFEKSLLTIPALQWEIEVEQETLKKFSNALRFDFGFIDEGYAWIFPKKRHLSVGILRTRRGSAPLKETLANYLETLGIEKPLHREPHGFVIPQKPRSGPLVRGRVLLAGDTAGFNDPIVQEGLSYAMLSGSLAAQAIGEGFPNPWHVESLYNTSIKKRILSDLPYARLLARVVYRMPSLRRFLFNRHGQEICDVMADLFSGQHSYRELVLSLKSYKHLLRAHP